MARRAAQWEAKLPPPPVVELVKRPWTVSRIAYTVVLWLLWSATVTWPFWLRIYAGDAGDAALLDEPRYLRDIGLVQRFGVALIFAVSIRLLFDNFVVSGFIVLLGLPLGCLNMLIVSEDIKNAESRNGVFLYTKHVTVREIEAWRGRRSSGVTATVDNPAFPGELIDFKAANVPGKVGDTLCADVFVGQLGGLWAMPPRKCTEPHASLK